MHRSVDAIDKLSRRLAILLAHKSEKTDEAVCKVHRTDANIAEFAFEWCISAVSVQVSLQQKENAHTANYHQ